MAFLKKYTLGIAKHFFKHRSWRGLNWHVDEAYIRIKGRWYYLWRAVDQKGQLIDVRLTARRDAKAARSLLKQSQDTVRLYQPVTITADKANTDRKVPEGIDQDWPETDKVRHIDRKYHSNRIESDHAALKKYFYPRRGFQSLRTSKAILKGIKTIRTIQKGHIHGKKPWGQRRSRFRTPTR